MSIEGCHINPNFKDSEDVFQACLNDCLVCFSKHHRSMIDIIMCDFNVLKLSNFMKLFTQDVELFDFDISQEKKEEILDGCLVDIYLVSFMSGVDKKDYIDLILDTFLNLGEERFITIILRRLVIDEDLELIKKIITSYPEYMQSRSNVVFYAQSLETLELLYPFDENIKRSKINTEAYEGSLLLSYCHKIYYHKNTEYIKMAEFLLENGADPRITSDGDDFPIRYINEDLPLRLKMLNKMMEKRIKLKVS